MMIYTKLKLLKYIIKFFYEDNFEIIYKKFNIFYIIIINII